MPLIMSDVKQPDLGEVVLDEDGVRHFIVRITLHADGYEYAARRIGLYGQAIRGRVSDLQWDEKQEVWVSMATT